MKKIKVIFSITLILISIGLQAQVENEIKAIILQNTISLSHINEFDSISTMKIKVNLKNKESIDYTLTTDYTEEFYQKKKQIIFKNNWIEKEINFFKDSIIVKAYDIYAQKEKVLYEYLKYIPKAEGGYSMYSLLTGNNYKIVIDQNSTNKTYKLIDLQTKKIVEEYIFRYDDNNIVSIIKHHPLSNNINILFLKSSYSIRIYAISATLALHSQQGKWKVKNSNKYTIIAINNRNKSLGEVHIDCNYKK